MLADRDYQHRAARLRATARWRHQVAGLTSLQLVELAQGILAGVMATDADAVLTVATNRAAERAMVRAAAFLAEAHARHPNMPKEKTDAN